jgi:hypothetical protein
MQMLLRQGRSFWSKERGTELLPKLLSKQERHHACKYILRYCRISMLKLIHICSVVDLRGPTATRRTKSPGSRAWICARFTNVRVIARPSPTTCVK